MLTQTPLQLVSPGLHVTPHWPPVHVPPGGQATPQPPQWFGSVCVLTQVPPQSVCPVGHPTQLPPTHVWPDPHAFPQVPQFCVVLRAVSHPSAGLPLQSPKPGLHV